MFSSVIWDDPESFFSSKKTRSVTISLEIEQNVELINQNLLLLLFWISQNCETLRAITTFYVLSDFYTDLIHQKHRSFASFISVLVLFL